MNFGALTHPGLARENNEDTYLADPTLGLFVVADGMGGHQAGEIASRLAVETVRRFLSQSPPAPAVGPEERLQEAIFAAHAAIRTAAREDFSQRGMGTTLLVALLPPPFRTLWLAHVGDSRAYLLRDGVLKQLTEDHTVLHQALKAGVLSPERKDEWPPRQMLSQAVGQGAFLAPSSQSIPLESRDRLLLCTDGLTDMLRDEEILFIKVRPKPPQEVCQALVEAANERGGKDNITVILIDVESVRRHNDGSHLACQGRAEAGPASDADRDHRGR